ncbi:NADH-quinone oxidoreductase subunit L [Horticoccus sp. 23ND18S-11]|uniref:NADH-quinone oxidoreductase subunit L n=1 Tax=Horticoccus sp. 23ND18S-11 TaxID=3391832 RepID=UPI0039C97CC6
MTMLQHAIFVLVLPLLSAAVIALFLRRSGGVAATVSTLTSATIAAIALLMALRGERFTASVEWLRLGDFSLSIGIKFDDLAALMLTIVGIVGLCVHVFSLGYMHDDSARARYFGGLSIFMFSMLGIVFADNLFMMFIFWELVGFSSWLLINHYLHKQSAADAAKKAFIVNRVGDFGFLLGIVWCYAQFGTTNLDELAKAVGGTTGVVVAAGLPLLLFCGAIGKSAQVPLQVWLPDAMEGPTPVSALIHAATMVAAGIYMLCRINVLMVPDALTVIMWVGAATALYAALCAITQSDIKKVLAYSTLSQLGYMVAAFGLGSVSQVHGDHSHILEAGVGAAMFHLTTHAFFKALMFLGSGSVIHACHHEQDIFKMGGLRKKLPLTFATFTIGVLAIIGTPFLAGFYSKDAILFLGYVNDKAVFAVLVFTAILTAFYMVRMWKIVFLGTPRSENADHAHEGGLTLTAPLVLLALLSVFGGYGWFYTSVFQGKFDEVIDLVPHAHDTDHWVILGTSVTVLLIGALSALAIYKPSATDSLAAKAPGLFSLLGLLRTSFDRFYDYYVEKVQQRFAMLLNFLEQILVAGVIVRGLAGVVGLFGLGARALHVGNANAYAYWFLLGAAGLWAYAAGVLNF